MQHSGPSQTLSARVFQNENVTLDGLLPSQTGKGFVSAKRQPLASVGNKSNIQAAKGKEHVETDAGASKVTQARKPRRALANITNATPAPRPAPEDRFQEAKEVKVSKLMTAQTPGLKTLNANAVALPLDDIFPEPERLAGKSGQEIEDEAVAAEQDEIREHVQRLAQAFAFSAFPGDESDVSRDLEDLDPELGRETMLVQLPYPSDDFDLPTFPAYDDLPW